MGNGKANGLFEVRAYTLNNVNVGLRMPMKNASKAGSIF
jgi:hypothetical protein